MVPITERRGAMTQFAQKSTMVAPRSWSQSFMSAFLLTKIRRMVVLLRRRAVAGIQYRRSLEGLPWVWVRVFDATPWRGRWWVRIAWRREERRAVVRGSRASVFILNPRPASPSSSLVRDSKTKTFFSKVSMDWSTAATLRTTFSINKIARSITERHSSSSSSERSKERPLPIRTPRAEACISRSCFMRSCFSRIS